MLPDHFHRPVQGVGPLHELQVRASAQQGPNPFDGRRLGVAYRHSDRITAVAVCPVRMVAVGRHCHRSCHHVASLHLLDPPDRTLIPWQQYSSSGSITVLVVGRATGSHVMIASSRFTSLETNSKLVRRSPCRTLTPPNPHPGVRLSSARIRGWSDELAPLLRRTCRDVPSSHVRTYPSPTRSGWGAGRRRAPAGLPGRDVGSASRPYNCWPKSSRLGSSIQVVALLAGNDPDLMLRCLRGRRRRFSAPALYRRSRWKPRWPSSPGSSPNRTRTGKSRPRLSP